MSWITRIVAKCDVCGWEWIPAVECPKHCGSGKCRSRLWNGSTAKLFQSTPRHGGRQADTKRCTQNAKKTAVALSD